MLSCTWPCQGRRLLVLGTTSAAAVMDDMGVAAAFNVALHVPALKEPDIRAVLARLAAFHPSDVRLEQSAMPPKRAHVLPEAC